ncbi:MAG: hypothetical protein CM15mP103_03800 [Gammaproteobacteria bacterium]|nr:MAG: hypothetical protein CM15mP103_03800 [Gammaproteobacteria bacterium]
MGEGYFSLFWVYRQRPLGRRVSAFLWVKGQQLGMVKEYGEYCAEWLAAKQNRFAVLPNLTLNYAYHFDSSLYAKFYVA